MKTLIAILLLVATSVSAQLTDDDKHFIAGVAIGAITIPVANHFGADLPQGWAPIMGLFIGVGKELLDHHLHRGRVETEEMHWDHVGDCFMTISGSMSVTIVVGPFLSHKRKNRYLLPEYH